MLLLGQAEDLHGVGQRGGHRLVDEHRLAGDDRRPRLGQVWPTIDALHQDRVDPFQQLVDRVDDLDSLAAELLGIAFT